MTCRVICIPFVVLFLASIFPSYSQKSVESSVMPTISVVAGSSLMIECPLRLEQHAEWRRNRVPVPGDMKQSEEVPAGDGRLIARLHVNPALQHHAGIYTCAPDETGGIQVYILPGPTSEGTPASSGTGEEPAKSADVAASMLGTNATVVYYDVNRNLSLECPLAAGTDTLVWTKNKNAIESVPELKERYKLEASNSVFSIVGRSQEDDNGTYSCAAGSTAHSWEVRGRHVVKLPQNTNVVEANKLKILCKVTGKPYPERVSWIYNNASEAENVSGVDVSVAFGPRVKLQKSDQGIIDAELVIESAERSDAGRYTCSVGSSTSTTTVRVKDMYAALWPFLGICAEVFILCAIILVYEKRRTKPELDDSDTDNHDQKKS